MLSLHLTNILYFQKMMRYKYLIFLIVCLFVHYNTIAQQNYRSLCDSCFHLLEKQDTLSFKKIVPQIFDLYAKEYDPYYVVTETLEDIRKVDQSLRLLYLESQKKRGVDDELTRWLHKYMRETDSKNAIYAKYLLQNYGWLTTDEISEDANEGLFLIVQHCEDVEVQSLCLTLLAEKLKDYPNERWHYAFLVDRFAMNSGREQTYGTQKIIKNRFPYPIPLLFPEKVDSLRKEMGLGSLWEELNDEYGGDWSLEKYQLKRDELKEVFQNYIKQRTQK